MKSLIFLFSLGSAVCFGAENPAHITAEILELKNREGFLKCSLHTNPDHFPKKEKKAIQRKKLLLKNTPEKVQVTFSGLKPGVYAISCFHDEDGDGELDSNFLGIPREGVAASRDAKGTMGPPEFKDAELALAAGQKLSIRFKMTY